MGLVPDAIRRARLAHAARGAARIEERPAQRPEFVAMVDRAVTEHDAPLRVVSGAVPADARLSYWAGGCWRTADRRLEHLLDAYSSGIRATIDGGEGHVRVRPFRDELQQEEDRAGRVLRKGLFTRVNGRLDERVTPVFGRHGAHDCLLWDDTLIASTQTRPFYLDPRSLETLDAGPFAGVEDESWSWANHPFVDPVERRLVTFRYHVGPAMTTEFEFLEISSGGGTRCRTYSWPTLLGPHAFSVTPRWYVLPDIAVHFAFSRFLLGQSRGILGEMEDDTRRGFVVHLVPREGGGEPVTVRFEMHGYAYHVIDSWEEGETVVFDAFVSNLNPERESSQFELDPAMPVWSNVGGIFRFTIDPVRRVAHKRLLVPGLQRLTFHEIDERRRGREYRHGWFVANDQHEGRSSVVGRYDATTGAVVERWMAGDGVFLRQLRVVPRGDAEGDAWLVVPAWTFDESRFLLFDALDLSRGPLVELGAGTVLPYPVHGTAAPFV
jgi:carotenoid cleavage dioxygenase